MGLGTGYNTTTAPGCIKIISIPQPPQSQPNSTKESKDIILGTAGDVHYKEILHGGGVYESK